MNTQPRLPEQILTDKEIDIAWGNANFGNVSKREVIRETLEKCAKGWRTGHTAQCIVGDLGLLNNGWYLSDKGYEYLISCYDQSPVPSPSVQGFIEKWERLLVALESTEGSAKYYPKRILDVKEIIADLQSLPVSESKGEGAGNFIFSTVVVEYELGQQYQRLYDAIHDTDGIANVSDMNEIIKIVHEDFPSSSTVSKEEAQGEWISVEERLPEAEGQYTCINYRITYPEKEYRYRPFTSNFKLYRMRETGELAPDNDGITGCFVSNGGYHDLVTHWRILPSPPSK